MFDATITCSLNHCSKFHGGAAGFVDTGAIRVIESPFCNIRPKRTRFPDFTLISSASSNTKLLYSSNPIIFPSMRVAMFSNSQISTRICLCRNVKITLIGCSRTRFDRVVILERGATKNSSVTWNEMSGRSRCPPLSANRTERNRCGDKERNVGAGNYKQGRCINGTDRTAFPPPRAQPRSPPATVVLSPLSMSLHIP